MLIKIKDFIFRVIYILILIYLCVFIPSFWGHKPLVVISGSMEPILKVGGILYYHTQDLKDFDTGDILVYQTKEHIFNETNLFDFNSESDIMGKDLLMNIIQIINETDGYVTYKVLPYNFTDWKLFSSNKVRILPNKCKDIKNCEYPLVDKLNQQISKYKR